MTKPTQIALEVALGFTLVMGVLLASIYHHRTRAASNETAAVEFQAVAVEHAKAAEGVPDHSAELGVALREVQRLKAKLAAIPEPEPAQDAEPDVRDREISAQKEVIEAQNVAIGKLQLALTDEQKRSAEWKSAYDAETKRAAAQQAATDAWKSAVTESRWLGRGEGFAVGLALGLLKGR